MKKATRPNAWMRSRAFCAIAAAALAVSAYAVPENAATATVPVSMYATAEENDSIYGTVDELPVFPGGDQACANWVAKKLKYPPKCKKEKIEGFVIVQFVVEKNGKVSNVKAIRSPHPDLAETAIRTMRKMPKWTPGKVGGKAVRSKLNLPVRFRL
ncbi:MAG: energy transducer TonB [Bacteroidaceae bacterium]|jgi:TonB family protein|nr:energy transducer TonB [Bacteroidaceae bacterium]